MGNAKLIAFDLDGTLAEIGCPILEETVQSLRELENRGTIIAFCSGKPVFYLCGLLRQLGLKRPVMLGENGAVMQIGVDLPPREHFTLPFSEKAERSMEQLKKAFRAELPELWYQPNQTMLTPFFRTEEEQQILRGIIRRMEGQIGDVDIYEHCDCFDIVPKGISKAEGIRALGKWLGIHPGEMIAVGDGVNDYPMFEAVGYAIGIRMAESTAVDRNVSDIAEAMEYLLAL